jgi:hypothetical protein
VLTHRPALIVHAGNVLPTSRLRHAQLRRRRVGCSCRPRAYLCTGARDYIHGVQRVLRALRAQELCSGLQALRGPAVPQGDLARQLPSPCAVLCRHFLVAGRVRAALPGHGRLGAVPPPARLRGRRPAAALLRRRVRRLVPPDSTPPRRLSDGGGSRSRGGAAAACTGSSICGSDHSAVQRGTLRLVPVRSPPAVRDGRARIGGDGIHCLGEIIARDVVVRLLARRHLSEPGCRRYPLSARAIAAALLLGASAREPPHG